MREPGVQGIPPPAPNRRILAFLPFPSAWIPAFAGMTAKSPSSVFFNNPEERALAAREAFAEYKKAARNAGIYRACPYELAEREGFLLYTTFS